MTELLQIALDKDNKLVSIYEVATGKDCECFCPACGSPLDAKNKGKISNETLKSGQKAAHFAHQKGSDCLYAPETAVHLLAKTVLQDNKTLLLPELSHNRVRLSDTKKITFDTVELEKVVIKDNVWIKPDALLTKDNRQLFVEFYKTHIVDDEKIEKIKLLGISCLEIDLNGFEAVIDGKLNYNGMKDGLENGSFFSMWLFNTKINDVGKGKAMEIDEVIQKEPENSVFVDSYRYSNFKLLSIKGNCGYYIVDNDGFPIEVTDEHDGSVDCPNKMINGIKQPIDLVDCKVCPFHDRIMKMDKFKRSVLCLFSKSLKSK